MIDTDMLISRADNYKRLLNIPEDTTISYRVFGDSKKLGALRNGADITVRRFNAAMLWFDRNWPNSQPIQPVEALPQTPEGTA